MDTTTYEAYTEAVYQFQQLLRPYTQYNEITGKKQKQEINFLLLFLHRQQKFKFHVN